MHSNDAEDDQYSTIVPSLRAAHKILQDLTDELQAELALVLKIDQQKNSSEFCAEIYSQVERRILVRSIFSYIEAITYATKALVLSDPHSSDLTEGERILASEVTYEFGSTGEVSIRPAKVSLTNNVRFTFKIFAKVFGSWTDLDTSGQAWGCFQRSIKVRNRITHPKESTDLFVTDVEVVDAYHSLNWFKGSCTRAAVECFATQNAKSQKLEAALVEITKMEGWNKIPAKLRAHITQLLLEPQPKIPVELSLIASKLMRERERRPDEDGAQPDDVLD